MEQCGSYDGGCSCQIGRHAIDRAYLHDFSPDGFDNSPSTDRCSQCHCGGTTKLDPKWYFGRGMETSDNQSTGDNPHRFLCIVCSVCVRLYGCSDDLHATELFVCFCQVPILENEFDNGIHDVTDN